jgi:hypothetical protein
VQGTSLTLELDLWVGGNKYDIVGTNFLAACLGTFCHVCVSVNSTGYVWVRGLGWGNACGVLFCHI